MIQKLLATLPHHTPLAIYGRGTNWLYGALVDYPFPQHFYQFDPRLGWVTPPQLTVMVQRRRQLKLIYGNATMHLSLCSLDV